MPDSPDSFEELQPTPGPIIPAREEHAQGIVDLRNRIARWLQGRGIDQWREGEFDPRDVSEEIGRGEWSVIESPEDPTVVLASVQVLWEDLRIWGKQEEPAGYVHGVAVDRSLRSTGTGPALIRHAEKVTRDSGRSVVRLDCDVNSPRLAEFYQGLGYLPCGTQDFYVAHQDFHVTVLRHELRLN
ncbi:GNAT family N-acetyltransferase [Kocuria carniphila]|uniref:GNAT family N-acetyltransferase n=1 Tax=Kocuria carniphila TaxID=262208 RepID=A0ABV3V1M5_9MICC|nr:MULTISPECIES: GNAT family N-acetyltransferase [Kocuria]MCT1802303.1 GNAT family N-acetyltransferase [Kocuria carniphila]